MDTTPGGRTRMMMTFECSPILASCMQITLINTFDSDKVCIRILSSSNFECNESMFRLRTVIVLYCW